MASPVALQNDKHAKLKITESGDYARYKDQHLIPIIAPDFFTLCAEFPVVFVKDSTGDQFVPVAIMGLREGQNLYCQTEEWKAQVVPIRFSNAPFSIVRIDAESDQLAVLVDEESSMLSETKGTPLFKEDGERSEYLEKKMEYLVNTAQQTVQTENICKLLKEKDLLTTQQLQLQHRQDSQRYDINGVYTVDEKKLNALSDEEFLDLRKQGIIPLIYAHLSSLQQLRRISEMQYNADKAAEASA
ncbi:MAG: multidrug transporter [SAR86 cluster bacterium]|uniref:Multidrug transporter n=1 Tax=SAR86 cluster bacterium TaxID=2030880 RepID=A0A2A4XAZ5_9GAMM|nr:MAG: multidrug transporter [SAR86 cluster bacterium]